MTEEERNEIVSLVIDAVRTNAKTIEQLTPVASLSDDDRFEISGGRSVPYSAIANQMRSVVSGSLNDVLAALDLERTQRTEQDGAHSAAISAASTRIDSLSASLTAETRARSNEDIAINDLIHDLDLKVDGEISDRASAIEAVNTALNELRGTDDGNDLRQIVDEMHDIIPTLAKKTEVSSAVSAEAVARDAAIDAAIRSEVTNRDSAIAAAVSNVGTNQMYAVNEAINNAIAAEVTNRNNAIGSAVSAEATARNTAISDAIATEIANRNTAIEQAVSAEAGARDGAISAAVSGLRTDIESRFVVLSEDEYEALTPAADRYYFIYE